MPPPSVQKLNALTSLRFFAAAMVLLLHASVLFKLPVNAWKPLALNNGVSFFFVLSGFILTYVYGEQSRLEYGRFMLARIARIWPTHIAALVLFLLLTSPVRWLECGWEVWLANITMTHAWVTSPRFYLSFVNPSWSISAEFAFYLCFPFLAHRLKSTYRWKLALAFSVPLLAGMLVHLPLYDPVERHSWIGRLMYFSPYGRMFEFVLGMVTAVFWRQFSPRLQLGLKAGTLTEVAAVALVLLTLSQAHAWSIKAESIWFIDGPGAVWLRSGGVACLPFAVLIFVMALEQGVLSRLLGCKPFVLLGEISYSVYLIHFPLLALGEQRACWLTTLSGWPGFCLYSFTVLSGSYLMWALIECPCRRCLISLWPKPLFATPVAQARNPQVAGSPSLRPSWRGVAVALVMLAGVAGLLWRIAPRRCEGVITMKTPNGQPCIGVVDLADHNQIAGWAWNAQKPKEPVQVEIYDGKKLVLTVTASQHRQDLVNHLGDCAHGFSVVTPPRFKDGRPHKLHVRIAQSTFELPSPVRIFNPAAAPNSVSQNTP